MLHRLKSCEMQTGGFCFENSRRNEVLESSLSELSYKAPSARKTGTTIAGIIYKDGVILGADTRATDDMVVADKNCMKIHYIAPKIYCCGAGVAADAEITTQIMASNVELHTLNTGRPPLVAMVTRQLKQMLFRYQGHVGASLIVGGVDVNGAHLYSVYPHGSYDKLPFLTMGSGAAAAVSVFEDRFKPNMEVILFSLIYLNATECYFFQIFVSTFLSKCGEYSSQLHQIVNCELHFGVEGSQRKVTLKNRLVCM
uniref:Proteasome subunit beta n=1 Tax=Anabas testudineus TaxID=64144 RepID=A0AAQ6IL68_ANATE